MENTVSAFGLVVFAVAAAAAIFLGEIVVHRYRQAPLMVTVHCSHWRTQC